MKNNPDSKYMVCGVGYDEFGRPRPRIGTPQYLVDKADRLYRKRQRDEQQRKAN